MQIAIGNDPHSKTLGCWFQALISVAAGFGEVAPAHPWFCSRNCNGLMRWPTVQIKTVLGIRRWYDPGISLRRRPARSCSQHAWFWLLGRNAAEREQKSF